MLALSVHASGLAREFFVSAEKRAMQRPNRSTIPLFIVARNRHSLPMYNIKNQHHGMLFLVQVLKLRTCTRINTFCIIYRSVASEKKGLLTIFRHAPPMKASTSQNANFEHIFKKNVDVITPFSCNRIKLFPILNRVQPIKF